MQKPRTFGKLQVCEQLMSFAFGTNLRSEARLRLAAEKQIFIPLKVWDGKNGGKDEQRGRSAEGGIKDRR